MRTAQYCLDHSRNWRKSPCAKFRTLQHRGSRVQGRHRCYDNSLIYYTIWRFGINNLRMSLFLDIKASFFKTCVWTYLLLWFPKAKHRRPKRRFSLYVSRKAKTLWPSSVLEVDSVNTEQTMFYILPPYKRKNLSTVNGGQKYIQTARTNQKRKTYRKKIDRLTEKSCFQFTILSYQIYGLSKQSVSDHLLSLNSHSWYFQISRFTYRLYSRLAKTCGVRFSNKTSK